MTSADRHACPVCGHRTLSVRCDWEICPVCLWEDDVLDEPGRDPCSPANGDMLLSTARANYLRSGACRPELSRLARPPRPDESRSAGEPPPRRPGADVAQVLT
ncbi:MAG: hypothetical protein KIT58_16500 [Planctomycetota bacterium]|nr:hypothetical protein [Planctomycetota bacterium]